MHAVAPVVGRMDKSRNLVEGDRLELECSSWGWPTPNITWWRRDAYSDVESETTNKTILVTDAGPTHSVTVRLTIEHVALSDYSKYVCVAANPLGTTNSTILVRVKGQRRPIAAVCSMVTFFPIVFRAPINSAVCLSDCLFVCPSVFVRHNPIPHQTQVW